MKPWYWDVTILDILQLCSSRSKFESNRLKITMSMKRNICDSFFVGLKNESVALSNGIQMLFW